MLIQDATLATNQIVKDRDGKLSIAASRTLTSACAAHRSHSTDVAHSTAVSTISGRNWLPNEQRLARQNEFLFANWLPRQPLATRPSKPLCQSEVPWWGTRNITLCPGAVKGCPRKILRLPRIVPKAVFPLNIFDFGPEDVTNLGRANWQSGRRLTISLCRARSSGD
jgi:hypothetical protein